MKPDDAHGSVGLNGVARNPAGAVLAASPWVFGFADVVWVPHVILGLTELAAAFVTKTSPADRRATAGRAL